MRCFKNIAELIKSKRLQHPKSYSQSELSHLLGYKNGQFISNVERALCNIPLKMLSRVSEVLDIKPEELKSAILKDHDETLNNYLKINGKIAGAEVTSIRTSEKNNTDMQSPAASNFSASEAFKMSSNS
jgi:transcriptional regulator with XRE-family HTH domain